MNGPRLREAGVEAVAVCLLWLMIGESMVNQWGQTRLICMDSCLRRNGMD